MSVTLEARYEPRMGGMFTFTPNGRAARGGGFGGSVATASGGAASASSPASGVSQVTIKSGGGGAGDGTSVLTPPQTNGRVGGFMRHADLWLVHSSPGKDDEVLQASTIARPGGGDFAFAPVTIQTKTGAVAVRVTGTLELGVDADGQSRFVFGATRRVMFTPSTRAPRDRTVPVDSGGVANTVLAIPGPDEVLSFEMPPIDAAGVPQMPDHFAIRVRLSPLVMRGVGPGGAQAGTQ
jgi:hypothetical protein